MNNPSLHRIDQSFIDRVCECLRTGTRVDEALPGGGRLQIDRQLPFLFIYRDPVDKPDEETERLISGEASFLITSSNRGVQTKLSGLLDAIMATLSAEFGSALLFEIWAGDEVEEDETTDPEAVRPNFTIHADRGEDEGMARVHDSLRDGLRRVKIMGKTAEVTTNYVRRAKPAKMPALLSAARMEALNCRRLGLEVQPIWRNPDRDEDFPMVLRTLHRGVSKALKRACFTFTLEETHDRPSHYLALGRQAVSEPMWEVDRELAAISGAFDFLLNVTPINTASAWRAFKRSQFEKKPVFHYRPIPVDPAELKYRLYSIDLNEVEDPTLDLLFREKRAELDRQLTMLVDRNTPSFLYGSMQLYGKVEDDLVQTATEILEKFPGRSGDDTSQGTVDAKQFAVTAQDEIARYRNQLSELDASVTITPETAGLMVSRGNLMLNDSMRLPKNRVRALIQHEVGTHVLTYWNARQQPFKLLASGLAGYDEFQEGLAVLSEHLVGGFGKARLRVLAGRVMAARYLEDGASFVETYRRLQDDNGFEQRTAFYTTMRIFRGGGLTKDAVYLRGLVSVLDYLKTGGDFELLLMGKIARRHIPIIRELRHREVLTLPVLRPSYLDDEQAQSRLKKVKEGLSPIQLVNLRSRSVSSKSLKPSKSNPNIPTTS